jgi:hypothetical protein
MVMRAMVDPKRPVREREKRAVASRCEAVRSREPNAPRFDQVFDGLRQLVVNNNIIELVHMAHFIPGGGRAAGDDILAVLAAAAQAALQFLDRRRQDEDADASGKALRTCCAPCQSISSRMSLPGRHLLDDPGARSAVEIAVHLGALEEVAALAHGLEGRHVDEMVFAAVTSPGRGARVV